MDRKVELKTFTFEEISLAAETLNTTLAGKRRIIMTPEQFSAVESKISPLPNSPGLPAGEIVPGVGGYLYNIPVFVDQTSSSSYML